MYERHDKKRIYWLMKEFLAHKIDEAVFCEEFYLSYNLSVDRSKLSDKESFLFSELRKITSRFSPFEEDHALDSRAFVNETELRNAIEETCRQLE